MRSRSGNKKIIMRRRFKRKSKVFTKRRNEIRLS